MFYDLVITCGVNAFYVESLEMSELVEMHEAAKERRKDGH